MRVLALDPGKTTGLAVVDNERIIFHDAVDISKVAFWVNHIRKEYQPTHLVIEVPPPILASIIRGYWTNCEHCLQDNFPDLPLLQVSPGLWKPLRHILGWPKKIMTEHEKDAICLAKYALRHEAGGK